MQIKLQDGKLEHVENVTGRALIAAGLASEVVAAEKPKALPNLKWAAHAGPIIGDFQHPPRIAWSCSTCGTSGTGFAEGPTVHLTTVVRHCGVAESCPPETAKRFVELRKAYDARKKKIHVEAGRPINAAAEKQAAELNRRKLADEALRIAKLAPVKA